MKGQFRRGEVMKRKSNADKPVYCDPFNKPTYPIPTKPVYEDAISSRVHELKLIQPYFNDVWTERKLFEVRKNDRGFKEGDLLILREYYKEKNLLRRRITARIIYILDDQEYVKEGYVVIGMKILDKY